MKKINVCLVGLRFGLEFVPIYLEHPDVGEVWVCDTKEDLLKLTQDRYSIPTEHCSTDIQTILDNPNIDAVHLVTPPATHAPLSIKVLQSGKHCGCTIPMGMSIQELKDIIIFALMLNEVKNLRFKKAVQTITYLPHFVSWVIMSTILTNIFGYNDRSCPNRRRNAPRQPHARHPALYTSHACNHRAVRGRWSLE